MTQFEAFGKLPGKLPRGHSLRYIVGSVLADGGRGIKAEEYPSQGCPFCSIGLFDFCWFQHISPAGRKFLGCETCRSGRWSKAGLELCRSRESWSWGAVPWYLSCHLYSWLMGLADIMCNQWLDKALLTRLMPQTQHWDPRRERERETGSRKRRGYEK